MKEDKKSNVNGLSATDDIFHAIIESLPQVVWIGDSEGKVTFLNKAWEDWTGLSIQESLGDGWIKAIHLDDVQCMIEKWEQARMEKESYEGACRFVHLNGEEIYCSFIGKPIFNAENKISNWIGLNIDITEQKRIENQLKNKLEELEKINDIMIDREIRMSELKKEIKNLKSTAL